MRKKVKDDKVLGLVEEVGIDGEYFPGEIAVTGRLDIGRKGNPVTLVVEDEVTGEVLELNHVNTAFIVVEDQRKSTSGWLALAVGGLDSLGQILGFMAKITTDGLKKMVKRD